MKCKHLLLFAAVSALLALAACSNPEWVAGGSASETGNALVMGRLVDPRQATGMSEVRLYPLHYNPVEDSAAVRVYADTTDAGGNYRFAEVEPGDYNIEGVHLENRDRALIFDIRVGTDDTVVVQTDTLRLPDQILIPLPISPNLETGYVYVPGTSIYYYLDSDLIMGDYIVVDSIPAGVRPVFYYSAY
jgi:hypothetical protein